MSAEMSAAAAGAAAVLGFVVSAAATLFGCTGVEGAVDDAPVLAGAAVRPVVCAAVFGCEAGGVVFSAAGGVACGFTFAVGLPATTFEAAACFTWATVSFFIVSALTGV